MSDATQAKADPVTRTPAIVLEHVSKQYGQGATILDNLSATIPPGEFVSIIGPSGCGKSTLLKLVAGLSPITSGKIVMERLTRVNARRITSFIFQDPTLLPWRTVRANVALGLELEHTNRASRNEIVDAMLALVGLADVAGMYPRELSGGMKMRVSLARALVTDPDILLLDEPFAALDEITRFRLNDDLLSLWRNLRKTVIFVTHSVFESVYLSQRVIVMTPRPGRLSAEFRIDAPGPRSEDFRTSADYAGYCRTVSKALASASGQPKP